MIRLPRPLIVLLFPSSLLLAGDAPFQESTEAPNPGVAQLRHAVGEWEVTTEFLAEDGSVARSVEGEYRFRWVVPDRVISGESDQPELGQKSAILFYVKQDRQEIEMCSVGPDGELWIMTGPIDGEVRTTAPKPLADGGSMQLRFTRFAVTEDGFESRMESSLDGGKSWHPGNHQVFVRKS